MNSRKRFHFKKKFNYKFGVKILLIFCHILLGSDFGYVNRPTTKAKNAIAFLTSSYCIIFSLISGYTYYVLLGETNLLLYYVLLMTLHYFLNSMLLVLYGYNGSFYKLQKFLMSIDKKLYVNSQSYGIEKKILFICGIFNLFILILNYVFCINDNNECMNSYWGTFVYITHQLSFNVIMIVSAFIFYSVYCRLKVFNGIVENSGSQVTEYLLMYKSIVNSLERAKGHLSLLVSKCLNNK